MYSVKNKINLKVDEILLHAVVISKFSVALRATLYACFMPCLIQLLFEKFLREILWKFFEK